jgi:hypothetical protein
VLKYLCNLFIGATFVHLNIEASNLEKNCKLFQTDRQFWLQKDPHRPFNLPPLPKSSFFPNQFEEISVQNFVQI